MTAATGTVLRRPLTSLSSPAPAFAVGRVTDQRFTPFASASRAFRAAAAWRRRPAGGRLIAAAWRRPVTGIAAGGWTTPDLPLYGNDHDRADFAP